MNESLTVSFASNAVCQRSPQGTTIRKQEQLRQSSGGWSLQVELEATFRLRADQGPQIESE